MKFALMLHLLGVVVWVGGMFFAYLCMRPAAGGLEPQQRLPLWLAALTRFFRWVWAAVTAVVGSGFYMLSVMAEAGTVPLYIYVMLGIGLLMTAIFVYVFFSPFATLRLAIAAQRWKDGGTALNRIRAAVALNLSLGIANILVATIAT